MKKILLKTLVLAVILTFDVQAQESKDITTEKWRCFEYLRFDNKAVLVRLTRETKNSVDLGFGEVSVAGVTYQAFFRVAGLDRRWDFGDEANYSFIIQPNGDGAYYDFSNVEVGGTTKPSQNFRCVSP